MPTYDYQCQACEHAFEAFESMTAEPQKKCPECGKLKLKRLIGAGAGLIFKGSGFYQTDYRSDNYSKTAKAEADGSSSKTDKSGETKVDPQKSKTPAAQTDTSAKKSAAKGDKKSVEP